MSIQSDFATYTNTLGFVSNTPNGSSGNDLLITAEAKLVQAENNIVSPDYVAAVLTHAEITPGLYGRPGWMQDQEGRDDYIGLVLLDQSLAQAILAYGRSHFWCFKTSTAATFLSTLFGTDLSFIAHVTWAAGETPNPLLRLAWCLSVAFSGSASEQDPWILNWLLTNVAGNKSWAERLATRIYKKRLGKAWGSLKNCLSSYYGSSHPIVKYTTD